MAGGWVSGGVLDAPVTRHPPPAPQPTAALSPPPSPPRSPAEEYATVLASVRAQARRKGKASASTAGKAAAIIATAAAPAPTKASAATASDSDTDAVDRWCPVCQQRWREATEAEHIRSIGHQVELQTSRASRPQYALSRNNVGFRMLQQAGWSPDQGLGRDNQVRPVQQNGEAPACTLTTRGCSSSRFIFLCRAARCLLRHGSRRTASG